MLILLVHHIIGVRPEVDHLRIRPRVLPGIKKIQASFPLRESRLRLEIKRSEKRESSVFRSNATLIHSSEKEACFSYSKEDIQVEAIIP